MHKKPHILSEGQRQRVAIGRALVNAPRIVIADEPTAALDKEMGERVMELLRQMARTLGTTVLIVTHDKRILDVADRIISMMDGRVVPDPGRQGASAR
jgi:putative ABC transport system ATP-binding protein